MMFLLGISLILGIFVWSLWQKALTEYTKNYLFDLRDNLRSWFIEKGHGLDHPSYKASREMLNASLWHVSRASYLQYLIFKMATKKHPEWARERQERLNRTLLSSDKDINDYIQSVREQAAIAFGLYITFKSFPVIFCSGVVGVFGSVFGVMAGAGKRLKPLFNDFTLPVPQLIRSALLCIVIFAFPIKSVGPISGNAMTAWSSNARSVAEQTLGLSAGSFRRNPH